MQQSSSLPTVVALCLAALLGACELKRSAGTNPPPGEGAPASASPAVGEVPDMLKYPWRATRWV